MSDEGKLFIGSLSYDTSEEMLTQAFSKYGTIAQVDLIRDKETGRSRGFAFVKYESIEDAKDALEAMNGKSLDGRAIRVDEAGKGGRSRNGGFNGPRGGGRFNRGRGGYGERSSGNYSYGERSYDRGFGSGDRNFSGGDRSFGSGYRSGGYRDNRGQGGYGERSGGYGERSGGSYRDGYDSYG